MTSKQSAALAIGGALAVFGLRPRTFARLAAAALLVYSVKHALTSSKPGPLSDHLRRILDTIGAGVNAGTCDDVAQAYKEARNPAGSTIDDLVDESSDDSFPASDPPSFSPRFT